ncbi:acetolactate synthase-like protein [Anneissia japonica]|uniref:acetolactate synthase-like protein n=1 Tax=Anneissia japonica TaxID=1529436 RepID=UPI001425A5E9|nr:acetolactate synthase-like protein [Anneissia japonica]
MIEYILAACGLLVVLIIAFLESKFGLIFQLFHKADADSSRNGGELVAAVLKEHGIKYLFTLCGGHISPVLVASEKSGIRVVDVRHEVTSVFAADAVARLSGVVGVAIVTAGPGLTNTITAVKNAQMAESPVLLMGGAAANLLKGRGALQDIDQMSLFKPLCKYCGSIKRVRDIVPTVRKALAVAQSGTPGPVFVELPIDTLYSYKSVQKEVVGGGGSKGGLVNSILSWYLKNYVSNMFAGAFEEQDVTPLPVHLPLASYLQVQEAIEILSRAKKPVLVLGSQATLPPTPADEIRKSLEAMGIPCFLGGMSRGMLGRNSAIHIRQKRRDALREADVVVLAGAVPDFRLNYGRHLSRKSKIIAVNRNKEQLYKNTDAFWKPSLAVQADVGSFLVSLQKGLKKFKCDEEWVKSLKSKDEEKEEANRKKATEAVNKFLNPLQVLYHVESTLDDNSILVADGGDFVGSAAYIVRPREPMCWLDPGAFGTLGVGGGFALGAKLVRPDAEVWIIYGDGSLGYSVAEFDTFTRHKCPVIAVVGNDACWTQIVREQEPMLGSRVGCDLAFCDYHIVAKGYGGSGLKLCGEEGEDVLKTLQTAQKECREGKPVLINCLIGRTNFRDGSISV